MITGGGGGGGSYTWETKVSVYREDGWSRDLASLKYGRHSHACAKFVDGGKKVG